MLYMLLNILITAVSFLIFPFIKYVIIPNKKEYSKDDIEFVLCLNSLIVAILWFFIGCLAYGFDTSINIHLDNIAETIITPIFYYFINYLIFYKFLNNYSIKRNRKKKTNINKQIKIYSKAKSDKNMKKNNYNLKIVLSVAILIVVLLGVCIFLTIQYLNYKTKYKQIENKYNSIEKLCDGKNFIIADKADGWIDLNNNNTYNGKVASIICDE